MYKLKITITKEIIEKSIMCGFESTYNFIGENCAFAIALKEIFPDAYITSTYAYLYGTRTFINSKNRSGFIILNTDMEKFINLFDKYGHVGRYGIDETMQKRRELAGQEFELELPDYVIDNINISEIQKILAETPHLELLNTK